MTQRGINYIYDKTNQQENQSFDSFHALLGKRIRLLSEMIIKKTFKVKELTWR